MPDAARVTMYFGQEQTGWSESWWYPPGRSTVFWSKLQAFAERRVALLNANHRLLAVRVTDEGANRFTRLLLGGQETALDIIGGNITLPGRGKEDGTGSTVEGPPDQVRAAMHVEVLLNAQRIGLRYLAGFPDTISLTENPTLNKGGATVWWQLFQLWRVGMVNDGFAIKALDKGVAFPLIPVVNYRLRAAAPSVIGVVVNSTLNFANVVGQKVALQGVRMTRRGLTSPNGLWYIDAIEVDQPNALRTIWLRGTEGFDSSTFLTLGKIRAVSYSLITPTWLEPIRVGIHKRGKPFGSPVGRRLRRA